MWIFEKPDKVEKGLIAIVQLGCFLLLLPFYILGWVAGCFVEAIEWGLKKYETR